MFVSLQNISIVASFSSSFIFRNVGLFSLTYLRFFIQTIFTLTKNRASNFSHETLAVIFNTLTVLAIATSCMKLNISLVQFFILGSERKRIYLLQFFHCLLSYCGKIFVIATSFALTTIITHNAILEALTIEF